MRWHHECLLKQCWKSSSQWNHREETNSWKQTFPVYPFFLVTWSWHVPVHRRAYVCQLTVLQMWPNYWNGSILYVFGFIRCFQEEQQSWMSYACRLFLPVCYESVIVVDIFQSLTKGWNLEEGGKGLKSEICKTRKNAVVGIYLQYVFVVSES